MAEQSDRTDHRDDHEPTLPFGQSGTVSVSDGETADDSSLSDAAGRDEEEPGGSHPGGEEEAEAGGEKAADLVDGDPESGSGSALEPGPDVESDLDVETEPAVELEVVSKRDSDSETPLESETESDDTDELEALAGGPTALDDFSHDDYVAATTVEYQGLAESVKAADEHVTELQAVAVTMPGLESGVVGFDDVTGGQVVTERVATEPRRSDLGLRIVTALVLMGMLVGALWAGGGWFVAFVTLIGILALGEYYATVRTAGYQPVALIGFLTLIAMMVAGFRYGPFGIVGWFTVGVVGVLIWYAVLVRRHPLANAAVTVLGFAWVGMLLSFIGPLAATAPFRQLVLAIVLTVAGLDVGSYFAGRRFGRHKMSPVLSPNKTYEGLLGGVVLAGAIAVGLSYVDWFAPLDLRGALFLTGVAVALGPFGDLAVSMLKRQVGVKDMGSILPGHGGVLDRIDALIVIVPVAYFVFSWLGYFAS